MVSQCIARAEEWLHSSTAWPRGQIAALAGITPGLLARLPSDPPWLLGIGGPPGTGKSTLAALLRHLWQGHPDAPPMVVLSLDDYYLPRAERDRLARGGAVRRVPLARHARPATKPCCSHADERAEETANVAVRCRDTLVPLQIPTGIFLLAGLRTRPCSRLARLRVTAVLHPLLKSS